jgi:uncharacterized coiled-coil DUF342 family protein
MLKRTFALAVLMLVVLVPAALAANGAPSNPSQPKSSGGAASFEQRLADIRQKIDKTVSEFNKRCASQHADAEKCTAAAKKLLAGLQKVDERIGGLVSKINARCDGASTDATTNAKGHDACAKADELVKKLTDVQSQIQHVEEKLQAWIDGNASGESSSSSDSSGDDSDLDSLDQLRAELAAVRQAAHQ